MKLKFKQQQYQTDAVMSVVNCFEGQKKGNRQDVLARYTKITDKNNLFQKVEDIEVISFGNHNITLTEIERRNNIRKVQRNNDIKYTENAGLTDFTIEMETGTGKTYTYIKTMYELNEYYGWSKFIIMVPSIAIREGVQKSFEITADHFQEIYKKKIRYFVYDSSNSSNIANINTFASDSSIQVMIINYQAFSGENNARGEANKRIFKELDELQSRRPIDVINSVKPILIIDEPQKLGDKTEEKLTAFKPLFTLRYSATHKKDKEYNKIYRLDAIDAYNQKLVKKINVKGIELLNNKSESAYLFLDSVNISQKHDPIARMEFEVKTSNGARREVRTFKSGDNLYELSGGLEAYKGYTISEIDGRYDQYDKVFFTNGEEIEVGQAFGDVDESHIIRIQIRETIRSHFEKEKELNKLGIKVLSLFFIDEVAKYKYYENSNPYKGNYALIFEEEYNKLVNEYRDLINVEYKNYLESFDTSKIHAGYFSIDKKGCEIDPTISDKKQMLSFDEDAYELIMKDKERLLSLEEPVRFIFSHSALREGWDNPNIFQICTLKRSNSEISKRQEIGRGLRICVNNNGERMDYSLLENSFHSINTLTVVASESYESFAKALQTEMLESLSERPKNFTYNAFEGKVLINEAGEKYEFTNEHYQDFLIYNVMNEYVDKNNNYGVTDKFIKDLENDKLDVMPDLVGFEKEIVNLMKKLYLSNTNIVSDERKENIKELKPNANFMKKEFQDLWSKINIKSFYEVSFDTNELITKCIDSINRKLRISKMYVKITEGTQKETVNQLLLNLGDTMTNGKSKTEVVEDFTLSTVKYDMIGTLSADTGLTRSTIVKIMSKIDKVVFDLFKYNPEEYLRKATNLINTEKATTIINGITYYKTDQKYDNDIFTINNVRGELGINAIDVKKNIYDFLVTDSKTEKEFARDLEKGEVTVYAKLPNGFKIPTPVGNYNPDWAIVFDNDHVKHIYFIAETKGTLNSLELREVEKAKIECAKKHFESISNGTIKYDVVDSYKTLIDMVM